MASSSAIRLPEGHTLSFLEASRGGTADYGALDAVMRDAVTQVIHSQTMTTHAGASLAQAQVHEGVKLEIIRADASLITDSFHAGPARWLTEWNYPGAAIPMVRRVIEDTPDRKTVADTDDDPYGVGLACWLYWPVWFQRSGLKGWLSFLAHGVISPLILATIFMDVPTQYIYFGDTTT